MISDSIADMLTIIRNGYLARLAKVKVRNSRLLRSLCEVLKSEGYITEYNEKGNELIVKLRYVYLEDMLTKVPVITKVIRISKPGRRHYVGVHSIPRVKGGLGDVILSTSRGVMTGKNAKVEGVGGEVLCTIW